jgi:hypothetical protein
LDKNKNEITHSIIDKGEITITSDKFGTTQSYYNIKQVVTKPIWTINNKKNNILTFTYDNKAITRKITLHIKHTELIFLAYESGFQDGTVANSSTFRHANPF